MQNLSAEILGLGECERLPTTTPLGDRESFLDRRKVDSPIAPPSSAGDTSRFTEARSIFTGMFLEHVDRTACTGVAYRRMNNTAAPTGTMEHQGSYATNNIYAAYQITRTGSTLAFRLTSFDHPGRKGGPSGPILLPEITTVDATMGDCPSD